MKSRYIFILLFLPNLVMAQQGFNSFLNSIESNNRSIISAKKLAEAEAIEAKTDIYLSNPEISYAHLGNGAENYSEMVVTQSFDFPSTYVHKNKISKLSEQQALLKYRQLKIELFLDAAQLYAEKTALNRKMLLFRELNGMMKQLQSNAEKSLALGEINILEANRIRSETARNMIELNILEVENQSLAIKISELNGGKDFEVSDTILPGLLESFHSDTIVQIILTNYPLKVYWENELEKAGRHIMLEKSYSLPKFEFGYRQDKSANEKFNGIHMGIAIPVFESKNKVKLAKAQKMYLQDEYSSEQLNFSNSIKKLVSEYEVTEESAIQLDTVLSTLNTPRLLMKAYQSGQISYTNLFTEYKNYIETHLYLSDLQEKAISLQLQLYVLMNY